MIRAFNPAKKNIFIMTRCSHRRLFFLTAAALSSTLPNTAVLAFVPPSPSHHHALSQTRLYSSDDNGFFGKVGEVAKKILPKSWTQTEEERKSAIQRKERSASIQGGLSEMLKDAPFPLRMMGGLVGPVLGSMVSGMADMVQSQQEQMETLLEDARGFIVADPSAASALGEPIMTQPPFSQSTSSSSINGKTSTNIQASFPVMGTLQQGIATMVANENGIQQLRLQVGGRDMNIQLLKQGQSRVSRSGGSTANLGNSKDNKGNIIDVEFTKKED